MYAFVRFLEDNLCYALPISCVKDFRPQSRLDFDNQKVYMVYQSPESDGEDPGNWGSLHKAQILALADDKADLENSVMQKKIKIPKLSLDGIGDPEPEELKDSEKSDEELGHNKSIQKQDGRKSEGTYRSLEAVVARLEKKNGTNFNSSTEDTLMETSESSSSDNQDVAVVPRIMYEELLRNYQQQQQDMRHLQQELERTRRQLVQQAKKLKEYGSLVSEVRELRDLNRRLQDVLLLRLGSDCVPAPFPSGTDGTPGNKKIDSSPNVEQLRVSCPDPVSEHEDIKPEPAESDFELQDSYSEEANTSSYHPAPVPVLDKYVLENGRVHLGNGIWVDEERWHQLQLTQGDSKFTKNLAVMIWGTNVLKNRSVTGVATKKKKDAVPKPPLSPHKLSIVRECLYDRIAQETVDETEIAQRLSKVNKYICEKIMDINKSCKNVERKESRFSLQ